MEKTAVVTNKRKSEISYLNILFCIVVIFIHSCFEPMGAFSQGSLPHYLTAALYRLSSFVVQGFIFLSGVKLYLNYKEPYDYVGAWLKQFKRIVLPYVLWVWIYYCYYVSIAWDVFSFKSLFKYIAVGNYAAHFYFVVIIVQFYLLAPLLIKLVKKAHPALLFLVSLVLMVFMWQYLPDILSKVLELSSFELINYPIRVYLKYIDRIFTSYLFYFVAGMVVGKYYDKFLYILRKSGWVVVFTFVTMTAGELCSYFFVSKVWFRFSEIFHVFYSVSAIIFAYYIVDLIVRNLPPRVPAFVRAMDNATYLVYLVHLLVMRIVQGEMDDNGILSTSVRFVLSFVLTVVISFTLSMLWQFISKKYNDRINKKAS